MHRTELQCFTSIRKKHIGLRLFNFISSSIICKCMLTKIATYHTTVYSPCGSERTLLTLSYVLTVFCFVLVSHLFMQTLRLILRFLLHGCYCQSSCYVLCYYYNSNDDYNYNSSCCNCDW